MLYLTYDNTSHKDGFASQLQRVVSIYCLAKEFGCEYIHSPFLDIEYQGLLALENNEKSENFVKKANEIFTLKSTSVPLALVEIVKMTYFSKEVFDRLLSESINKNIVISILYAHKYTDTCVSVFRHLPTFFSAKPMNRESLQIAVHIRRGELFVVDSERLLPNEYFLYVMNVLRLLLQDRPHTFTVYTEKPTAARLISPHSHGMCERFVENRFLHPDQTDLRPFENFQNTVCKVNTDPFEAFQDMCQADILVCSLSSFSYTAALLNTQGIVLMPKKRFWHASLPTWIDTESETDLLNLRQRLQDK
jgi:hypothetical protein